MMESHFMKNKKTKSVKATKKLEQQIEEELKVADPIEEMVFDKGTDVSPAESETDETRDGSTNVRYNKQNS